jgi:DNA repair exonuclease SbcCD ATPase subunit
MRSIRKTDLKRIQTLQKRIADQDKRVQVALDALQNIVTAAESAIEACTAQVEAAMEDSNEQRHELRSLLEDIYNTAYDYYSERSERWKESEAGEQYDRWLDILDNHVVDDLDAPEVTIVAYDWPNIEKLSADLTLPRTPQDVD